MVQTPPVPVSAVSPSAVDRTPSFGDAVVVEPVVSASAAPVAPAAASAPAPNDVRRRAGVNAFHDKMKSKLAAERLNAYATSLNERVAALRYRHHAPQENAEVTLECLRARILSRLDEAVSARERMRVTCSYGMLDAVRGMLPSDTFHVSVCKVSYGVTVEFHLRERPVARCDDELNVVSGLFVLLMVIMLIGAATHGHHERLNSLVGRFTDSYVCLVENATLVSPGGETFGRRRLYGLGPQRRIQLNEGDRVASAATSQTCWLADTTMGLSDFVVAAPKPSDVVSSVFVRGDVKCLCVTGVSEFMQRKLLADSTTKRAGGIEWTSTYEKGVPECQRGALQCFAR